MVSASHLWRLQQLHLLVPKEFHMGVVIQVLTSHNFENVLLIASLTEKPSRLICFSRLCSLSFKSLHSSRVAFKVALSFSGPHIAKEAFGFAGASDALVFLLLAFSIAFSAVEHGLHCSCSAEDLIISQSTDRYTTVTSNCFSSFDMAFGKEWRTTVPEGAVCDVGSTTTDLTSSLSGNPSHKTDSLIVCSRSLTVLYLTLRFLSLYTVWEHGSGQLYTHAENSRPVSTIMVYFDRQCTLSHNSNLTVSSSDKSTFHGSKFSLFNCFKNALNWSLSRFWEVDVEVLGSLLIKVLLGTAGFGSSCDFVGIFSVGTLPNAKTFLVGSIFNYIKQLIQYKIISVRIEAICIWP